MSKFTPIQSIVSLSGDEKMSGKFTLTFRKGGAGSGHHGHRGRPGKRGGSVSGGGAGAGAPDVVGAGAPDAGDDWQTWYIGKIPTYSFEDAERASQNAARGSDFKYPAVVQTAGRYSYKRAVEEYGDEDTGFYTAKIGSNRTVRVMGYFPGQKGVPQPGQKIVFHHDAHGGKQTVYRGVVTEDDKKSYTLWHYD